jgi:hypothetical protein
MTCCSSLGAEAHYRIHYRAHEDKHKGNRFQSRYADAGPLSVRKGMNDSPPPHSGHFVTRSRVRALPSMRSLVSGRERSGDVDEVSARAPSLARVELGASPLPFPYGEVVPDARLSRSSTETTDLAGFNRSSSWPNPSGCPPVVMRPADTRLPNAWKRRLLGCRDSRHAGFTLVFVLPATAGEDGPRIETTVSRPLASVKYCTILSFRTCRARSDAFPPPHNGSHA